MKKNLFLAQVLFTFVILFSSCARTTLKLFTDPSIQSNAIKSVAVFSMRNTAFSPGETMDMNRSMTQGVQKKNPNVKIVGPSDANFKINEAGLADEYANFLRDFEYSGLPNTTILKKLGEKLGVEAILQGRISDIIQIDGALNRQAVTSATLRYTLLSTQTGNILWEGTSNARKTGVTALSKAPPLYEVTMLTQVKIMSGFPTLGK